VIPIPERFKTFRRFPWTAPCFSSNATRASTFSAKVLPRGIGVGATLRLPALGVVERLAR
jgi:hypothetical protein